MRTSIVFEGRKKNFSWHKMFKGLWFLSLDNSGEINVCVYTYAPPSTYIVNVWVSSAVALTIGFVIYQRVLAFCSAIRSLFFLGAGIIGPGTLPDPNLH